MDVFIARQPIFNEHRKLFAYELLYRGTKTHTLTSVTGERATTSLLSSTFLTEGIEIISGSRPCFINFTEDLLLKKVPFSFPKTRIVVEILEDVEPTEEIIRECKLLSKKGYTLALDDFVYDRRFDPLIEFVDIIKIDFRLSPFDEILKTVHKLKRFNIKLLAEKVETHDEFKKAMKMGFTYFQGYFFCRPESIKIKELAAAKLSLIHLLAEVTKKTTTIDRLHEIISKDISISYKLLRFLNSAYFYLVQKVTTVKHAIAYLGEKELRSFIMLVLVSELASDKPEELVRQALVRARFCELLALESIFAENASEIYLIGLFSLIDVMLDTPMEEIANKLPLSPETRQALIHNSGEFAPFMEIIKVYERLQVKKLAHALAPLQIQEERVADIYLKAIHYANALT
jgi:c-di-GMP-related signal transduction protein